MVAADARKKRVTVRVLDPDTSIAVVGDRRRIRQVLLNLLSNALKYAPENSEVSIAASLSADSSVRISVADQGPGIQADIQDHIFEEFQQADRERDEALGGIGLGLSLSRRLVEIHGGTIGVESAVGKGSTFWFTLPDTVLAEQTSPVTSSKPVAASRGNGDLILVAEDNATNRMALLDSLRFRGYTTVTAHNGEECVEMARQHRPRLIITDVHMPVMNGLEAVQILRNDPDFESTPIIALTADATEASREQCIDAGCTAHLSKPIRLAELFSALQALLDSHFESEN